MITTNRSTNAQPFLGAGITAGVLVPLIVLIDGATRTGYSLWRNGVSQLGTGDRAWLFTTTFVVGGLLLGLFAVGLRRTLRNGPAAVWGPIMITVAAIGLIVGGLVPTDPALDYPPGARSAAVSTAGAVHQVAGLMIFAGLASAAFILTRRLRRDRPGWANYSLITGILIIVLAFAAGIAYRLDTLGLWRPAPAGLLEQLSLLLGYCWAVAVAVHYLRGGAKIATGR